MVCQAQGAPGLRPSYSITNWQTEDGLPENSATSIVQTPDGYLWIGTFHGLVRFDGRRFVVFDLRNMPSLPNVGVVHLHLESGGRFWVSTLGGLASHRQGKWSSFGPQEGWTGDYVRHSTESPDGTVVFSSFDRKVFRFDGTRFHALPRCPGGDRVHFPYFSPEGVLHVATEEYLNRWNGAGWDSTALPPELRGGDPLITWGVSPGGELWAAKGKRLVRFQNGRTVQTILLRESVDSPWSMTVEEGGPIWIATYLQGLFRVDRDGRQERFGAGGGFHSSNARFVFKDRQGNRWIGTSGAGLFRFRDWRVEAIGRADGLPDFPVKGVAAEPDGSVLLATFGGGLWRYHSGFVRAEPIRHGNSRFVQSLLRDTRGRVWIGLHGNQLLRREGAAEEAVLGDSPLGMGTISLYEDSRGRIWMAGAAGVALLEAQRSRAIPLDGSYPGVPIRCFAEDRETGEVFAGGDGGLFRLQDTGFRRVLDAAGQPLPPITAIHARGGGAVWLGTATQQLICWRGGVLHRISDKVLPFGVIGGFAETGSTLWIATNRGVFRLPADRLELMFQGRAESLEWDRLTRQDGLPSEECTIDHQPSLTRDSRGRLWVSTLKGAALIDPAHFHSEVMDVGVKVEEIHY
ncbi:MAG: hypothetical protein MUC42_02090, partial [Bryobacter sp.]|nr:hypothetical protein [Bryobacter sp.]